MEVSWKDSRKDISALGVDMTTRVQEVAGHTLLYLPLPPLKTVGKDIHRKACSLFPLICIKIFLPARLTLIYYSEAWKGVFISPLSLKDL